MERKRWRAMLLSQRQAARLKLPPLGGPPDHLGSAAVAAWRDVVREIPLRPTGSDAISLELIAIMLAVWRSGRHEREPVLALSRTLGDFFVPMAARRRLLFPDRISRLTYG